MFQSPEDIAEATLHKTVPPGARPSRLEHVRYVSFVRPAKPANVFDDVVWKVDPPIVQNGGITLEPWILTIPDGTPFYALEYNGDVTEWEQQIERGAELCGVLSARIEGEQFIVSDGRSYQLSECVAEHVPYSRAS
jgi:hypothetical protein